MFCQGGLFERMHCVRVCVWCFLSAEMLVLNGSLYQTSNGLLTFKSSMRVKRDLSMAILLRITLSMGFLLFKLGRSKHLSIVFFTPHSHWLQMMSAL